MKFQIFSKPDSDPRRPERRAVMLFAGWGMDEKPFRRLSVRGYDLIVLWDYRDPSFPAELDSLLGTYAEIAVIGWSFGVPAAARFIAARPDLPLTASVAVNGTMHPVDDLLGIPEAVFNGTLEGLTEQSLRKFRLRMAGGAAAFERFALSLPTRTVDDLRAELESVRSAGTPESLPLWDVAVVGTADRIVPPASQLRAWESEACAVVTADIPHLPDFSTVISRFITEKATVADRFGRSGATYDDNAVVQRAIAGRLLDMAFPTPRCAGSEPLRVLEIGCGTGAVTRRLAEAMAVGEIEAWDLHIQPGIPALVADVGIAIRSCDGETSIASVEPESLDMILSASTVQWFNSLPAFLRRAARALRPGGSLLISTFGPDNMKEIAGFLPAPLHYPDLTALRRMVPPDLRLELLEEERGVLVFDTPADALHHIRLTGVNALGGAESAPAAARRILRGYPLRSDGAATLTYHPVYLKLTKLSPEPTVKSQSKESQQ